MQRVVVYDPLIIRSFKMTEKKPLTKAQQEFLNRSAKQDLPKVIRDWKPPKESSKKTSKAATAYGKARGVISKTYPGGGPGSAENVDKIFKELKAKSPEDQQKAMKRMFGKTRYEKLAKKGFFSKALTKGALKLALAALAGPVGLLAGISQAAAATPAGAGEDELLYEMRRKKVPGGGPDEAYFKRQKSGSKKEKKKGGKIKKNYAKGGGVRSANY